LLSRRVAINDQDIRVLPGDIDEVGAQIAHQKLEAEDDHDPDRQDP
jgi:hypothetical protein